MQFTSDYLWLQSYLDNDSLWLEDSLNWDNAFDLALRDYSSFSFFTSPFFFSIHLFFDFITKLAFLDLSFFSEVNQIETSRELFESVMWDLVSNSRITFFPDQFFFYTEYQDFIVLVLYHSPELTAAIVDFVEIYWKGSISQCSPTVVFDLYSDNTTSAITEVLDYAVAFCIFVWLMTLFFNSLGFLKWGTIIETYLVRIHNFSFSISRKVRLQLESVVQTFFIFVLYFAVMIATLDDDQEELMEAFTVCNFYLFTTLLIYLVYRYSVHFFSFLASSDAKKNSLSLVSQFITDVLDSLGVLLRLFVLLARLNLYDFLDDILDSYYIFVCDFDDDEYRTELAFAAQHAAAFDIDSLDDRSIFFEDEVDFNNDLFSIYFMTWSKFSLFYFFAIEECLRVLLAFYLTYLVLFEMQAGDKSYVEDSYLFKKRTQLPFKITLRGYSKDL